MVRASRGTRGSDSNARRGSSDRRLAVALAVAVAVVAAGCVAVPGSDSRAEEPPLNETAAESLVVEAVNQQRIEAGVTPVEADPELAAVARNHSEDMAQRGYYAHETPEGIGPSERVRRAGVACTAVGENIAASWYGTAFESDEGVDEHTTPEELANGLVDQWRGSLSHHNNMLDPHWETTGVGIRVTGENEVIATQLFCERER